MCVREKESIITTSLWTVKRACLSSVFTKYVNSGERKNHIAVPAGNKRQTAFHQQHSGGWGGVAAPTTTSWAPDTRYLQAGETDPWLCNIMPPSSWLAGLSGR